jgi:hypothetical protein
MQFEHNYTIFLETVLPMPATIISLHPAARFNKRFEDKRNKGELSKVASENNYECFMMPPSLTGAQYLGSEPLKGLCLRPLSQRCGLAIIF